MATLKGTYLTLADTYKRTDKYGNVADVIEMLNTNNSMLDDMISIECNEGNTHLTTMRTGLPKVAFRRLYEGVQPDKSIVRQVRDATAMIEARSQVDCKLVDVYGSDAEKNKFRAQESAAFVEAISQLMQEKLIYGSTANAPEQFTGIIPRFNDLAAENASQIVDAGGTGDNNCSILFVVWSPTTVHGLYPKGSKAGIEISDRGMVDATDASGGKYDAYETVFKMDIGLSVRNWQYIARICNIDHEKMMNGEVDLYKLMTRAFYRLKQREASGGRAAIYCNRDVLETLDLLATNKGANDSYVRLSTREVEGKEIKTYRGIPIRQVDAMLNTEARVVASV